MTKPPIDEAVREAIRGVGRVLTREVEAFTQRHPRPEEPLKKGAPTTPDRTAELRETIARSIHRYQPTLPTWEACLTRADAVLGDLAASGYEIKKLEDR